MMGRAFDSPAGAETLNPFATPTAGRIELRNTTRGHPACVKRRNLDVTPLVDIGRDKNSMSTIHDRKLTIAFLMALMTASAILIWIATFGFWSSVAAYGILGAVILATVASTVVRSSFVISLVTGSIGRLSGVVTAAAIRRDQPTIYVTTSEYETLLFNSLIRIGLISTVALFGGGLIGAYCHCLISKRKPKFELNSDE